MRVAGLVLALVAAGLTTASPAYAGAPAPAQEVVGLLKPHGVLSALDTPDARKARIGAWRPITGTRTVLPVVGHATATDGVEWLRVMLPGRPNGSEGWIVNRKTELTTTSWHIVVTTASRRVIVYRAGRRVKSFRAIVGKPSTPTPHGQFFVEENVRMLAGAAGAPFALATSARSNVLQEFEGGPGQIAIHGVGNIGGRPGTAVSHGCVRLANRNIRWLAARIAPGVPITITA